MNKNNITILRLIGIFIVFFIITTFPVFGSDCKKHDHDAHHKKNSEEHHHKAHHGGYLNAIEKCEIAHIEVKVEDNVIKCWFVGGGHDTNRSVRIPDREIILEVKSDKIKDKKLVLKPKPIELAEEKAGDCSCFEGRANWLSSLKEFEAFGKATIKGKVRNIQIQYPDGYDPDHDHEYEHNHDHDHEHE